MGIVVRLRWSQERQEISIRNLPRVEQQRLSVLGLDREIGDNIGGHGYEIAELDITSIVMSIRSSNRSRE